MPHDPYWGDPSLDIDAQAVAETRQLIDPDWDSEGYDLTALVPPAWRSDDGYSAG